MLLGCRCHSSPPPFVNIGLELIIGFVYASILHFPPPVQVCACCLDGVDYRVC